MGKLTDDGVLKETEEDRGPNEIQLTFPCCGGKDVLHVSYKTTDMVLMTDVFFRIGEKLGAKFDLNVSKKGGD